jgi:sec-independent protein translocase protein TatA
MPIRFGSTELVIILVIVILLFGVGRIGKIAGELGSGISAFRKAINPDEKEKKEE